METQNMLEIISVSKTYKGELIKQIANKINKKEPYLSVNNVTLNIKKGEIMGILGSNGAGKSTLIKLICGLIPPDKGTISINGYDISKEPAKAKSSIGAVIENPAFFSRMTGRENLSYFGALKGGISPKRIDSLAEIVGLNARINDKVFAYSLGMKQRLGIALAIMNSPSFLILDEPLNGLDPSAIIETRELLLSLKEKHGTTIFISSHILSELQEISDRIAIMSHGKISAVKTKEEISHYDGKAIVKINCSNNTEAERVLLSNFGCRIKIVNNELYVETDERLVADINKALILANIEVFSIAMKKRSLEELYKEVFRD